MTKSPHGSFAHLSWTRKYKRLDAFFTVLLMCSFHDKSRVIITPSSFALLTASSWLPFTRIGWNSDSFLVKEILSSLHFSLFSWTLLSIACSRLRDGGGKSFSNKKCQTRATAPFPKSCASYFRFARFNTFQLYYLRAWHRLYYLRTTGIHGLLHVVHYTVKGWKRWRFKCIFVELG